VRELLRATPRRRSAAFEAAGALGARRIVMTTGGKLALGARAAGVPVIPVPGGFQPRSAVAYSLVVALEVAGLCGAGERLHAEIDVAAAAPRTSSRHGGRRRPRTAWPSSSPTVSMGRCRRWRAPG